MKLWIAKNSEIPVREQIVTQVTLAIASGELTTGVKLPSTAEIARRFGLHANTVAHAYQELADRDWLEFRHGSGFFVRDLNAGSVSLDRMVADFLRQAREHGFAADDVLECVSKFTSRRPPTRLVLLEDDPEYRAILHAEIADSIGAEPDSFPTSAFEPPDGAILTAMFDERPKIPDTPDCVFLNARSVAEALAVENRPTNEDLIAVLSGWDKFLLLGKTMLIAARIDPESLIVRSTRAKGWRNGVDTATMIICDALTAREFDGDPRLRVFRLIADSSLAELSPKINSRTLA